MCGLINDIFTTDLHYFPSAEREMCGNERGGAFVTLGRSAVLKPKYLLINTGVDCISFSLARKINCYPVVSIFGSINMPKGGDDA